MVMKRVLVEKKKIKLVPVPVIKAHIRRRGLTSFVPNLGTRWS
jgi:hypothetical protein